MATITKYGDDFYVIERLACMGHKDRDGRMLAGPASLTFAFRREDDPPHVNVDPVDVLEVLAQHFADSNQSHAAARVADVIAALTGESPPRRKAGRPKKEQPEPAAA